MNRFAKIMQGTGWLAGALWLAAWAQGYAVGGERAELALHTAIALAAAALTLLSRCWAIAYLALASIGRRGDAAATRWRRRALPMSLLAIGLMAVVFVLSGSILWRTITPLVHAATGGALIATHLAALIWERRALVADAAASRLRASS